MNVTEKSLAELEHTQIRIFLFVNSLALSIAVFLGIFMIVNKRLRRFESKVLLLIICYHTNLIICFCVKIFFDVTKNNDLILFYITAEACFLLKDWIFASQYMKACVLLPSFIKKRMTLLAMYDGKSE